MGAAESANRSQEEEEERGRRGERLNAGGAAAAAMGAVAVGTAAVGIYKMLSSNTNTVKVKHESESMMVGATSSREGQRATTIKSTWAPPPRGRLKMNTDATCRPHAQAQDQQMGMVSHDDSVRRGPSGYGVIIRDDGGNWFRGFRGYIGVTDCLTAEFKAIFSGLKLLDKYGYVGAILESDSHQAVGWIQRDDTEYLRNSSIIGPLWPEIKECKGLVAKNRITITACFRDANKCADKLADMGLALDKQLINHEGRCEEILIIPFEIQQIVDDEASAI